MARISNAAAKSALDAILAIANKGADSRIYVYTGIAPFTCEAPASGTILATLIPFSGSNSAFYPASDGGGKAHSSLRTIQDDASANSSGVPGYIRYTNSSGTVFQATAGGPTSSAECVFDKASFESGDIVKILSLALEMPE